MSDQTRVVRHGCRDGYRWIRSTIGSVASLVEAVPELVVGKVVAITSFDSGPLTLFAADLAAGWTAEQGIAFSPRVVTIDQLPMSEYDEWYVFEQRPSLPALQVLVNCSDFTPDPVAARLDLTRFRAAPEDLLAWQRERAETLWRQLSLVQPVSFLAGGDALTCVVRDERMGDRVLAAIERLKD